MHACKLSARPPHAGGTLIEVMANSKAGRLDEASALPGVVAPLLVALASLHAMGVVHRDIKVSRRA
jgi:serine/threonine protein kinase